MTNTYESVYSTHKDRVIEDRNKVVTREAYNYEPAKDVQGDDIEFIKQYANTKIKEVDAERMKCTMIQELTRMCRVISDMENDISQSKIYAAFVVRGINIRYHDWKTGNQDVIYDILDHVKDCQSTYDKDLMEFTTHSDSLFDGAKQDTVRFENTITGRAKKSAKCGIRLSDVNLYNALAGVERFDDSNPDYLPQKGRWIIESCLTAFSGAKRKLTFRDMGLQCILRHEDEMKG